MNTPIIDNNALTASLRALKLGGMLQTLDARLAQARAGELGHLEFLQVLCHDEISRRETTAITRRTRRARFEETLTLEGFDFTAAPKLPAAQIRDLAALRRLQAGESVILYGPVGAGKTHIAQALAHLAIRAGAEARFTKTSRALADLAGGHADGTWTRRLRELARPAVLVLDDFAMRELTTTQADDLYELINERAGRSLILTSNRSPVDWYPLFPNPVIAESLLDRLINNSHQLLMNGAGYRPHKRPGHLAPRTPRHPDRLPTTGQTRGNYLIPPLGELPDRSQDDVGDVVRDTGRDMECVPSRQMWMVLVDGDGTRDRATVDRENLAEQAEDAASHLGTGPVVTSRAPVLDLLHHLGGGDGVEGLVSDLPHHGSARGAIRMIGAARVPHDRRVDEARHAR